MTLSKSSAEEEVWSESCLMMEVKKQLRPCGCYDDRTFMKVVKTKKIKHLDIKEQTLGRPSTALTDPAKERTRLFDFANLVNWLM